MPAGRLSGVLKNLRWSGLEKLVTCPTWVSGPLPPFCPRGLRGSHPTNVCKCFEIFLQCVWTKEGGNSWSWCNWG